MRNTSRPEEHFENSALLCVTRHQCQLLYGGGVVVWSAISLGDVRFHANTERFQGLVPLWSHLCPLSVRLGGVCGSYSESP